MATGELSREQREMLEKELGRHFVVDKPPFERCNCGDSLRSAANDMGWHRLEVAFEFGIKIGKMPKPHRKVISAAGVKVGHQVMYGRKRTTVTFIDDRSKPGWRRVSGTFKAKPSDLHRTSTEFSVRPDADIVVMNWLPPID